MGRKSMRMSAAANDREEASQVGQDYSAMGWRKLQSVASGRGVLRRGMDRDQIEQALLQADAAGGAGE